MSQVQVFGNARLFDGIGDVAIDGASIVTEDGRFAWAGPSGELPEAYAQTPAVDLAGAFVMPGMIDAHVHLQTPLKGRGDLPLSFFEYLESTAIKAAYNAQVYLATGFTTVMDVGCRGNVAVAVRDAIDIGLAVGPRVVASGPQISPTGGLADDFLSFVHNDIVHGVVADTVDELRVAVRTQVKAGVDNIKIGVSGSSVKATSSSYVSDMEAADIAAVVEEAHRAGCTVAAHCHPTRGFLDCLRSGVDTVHHGYHIDERCIEPFLEAQDTYFVPTIWKLRGTAEGAAAMGRAPELIRPMASAGDGFSRVISELIRNGGAPRMAVGSDAGHVITHGTTAKELSYLVDAGMTPSQALRSATSVAAAAIRQGETTGAIKDGLAADFLVVDGDPLADVTVLQDRTRILAVYRSARLMAERGRVVAVPDTDMSFPARSTSGRRHRGPIREG